MSKLAQIRAETIEACAAADDMDDDADYLRRGRRWKDADTDHLKAEWIRLTKTWSQDRSAETGRDRDDVASELRLRAIPLPYELVQAEMAVLRSKLATRGPDPSLRERMADFSRRYRQPDG